MSDNKVKVTASMDAELVEWIDKEVESRRFASRTHALEFAASRLKNEIEKGQA
jgi:Arc/MetJ-type ribon-helix-helix transcriptional regulator